MSVKPGANGRRSAEVQFEVAGTPEDVWQAIATGPGISSWFVPAQVETLDGKPVAINYQFGPGMEMRATLNAYDAPRLLGGEVEAYGGAPPIATEWHIEAQAGGTCIIRMVHSLFASTDEWDGHLEGAAGGWSGFLSILKLYLKHFPGQRTALMQLTAPVEGPDAESWKALTGALGMQSADVGAHWTTPAGAPALSGVIEGVTEDSYDALVRLDAPVPGIAAIGSATYPGGQCMVAMNIYMYGERAAEYIAHETPVWQAWFAEQFPMPMEAGREGAGA